MRDGSEKVGPKELTLLFDVLDGSDVREHGDQLRSSVDHLGLHLNEPLFRFRQLEYILSLKLNGTAYLTQAR
jgi:hypothetical protein